MKDKKTFIFFVLNLLCMFMMMSCTSSTPPSGWPTCAPDIGGVNYTSNLINREFYQYNFDNSPDQISLTGLTIDAGTSYKINVTGQVISCLPQESRLAVFANSADNNSITIATTADGGDIEVEKNALIFIELLPNNVHAFCKGDILPLCENYSNNIIAQEKLINGNDQFAFGSDGQDLQVYLDHTKIYENNLGSFPTLSQLLNISSNQFVTGFKYDGGLMSSGMIVIESGNYSGKLGFKISDKYTLGGYRLKVTVQQGQQCYHTPFSEKGTISYYIMQQTTSLTSDTDGKIISAPNQHIKSNIGGTLGVKSNYPITAYSGSYYTIELSHYKTTYIGNLLYNVAHQMKSMASQVSEQIFDGIINYNFLGFVRTLLVLYVIFMGIYYVLGLTDISQKQLMYQVVKIGVVNILLHPNSFNIFNKYFFSIFTNGMDTLIYFLSGAEAGSPSGIFIIVDQVILEIFNSTVWMKIAYLIISLSGVVLFVMVIILIVKYTFILIEGVISYIVAIVAVYFLISLAPLFISFILFERTKKFFDGWVKYLSNFALQPAFFFSVFSILNTLILNAFYNFVNFRLCWGQLFDFYINMGFIPIIGPILSAIGENYVDIATFYFYTPNISEVIAGLAVLGLFIFLLRGIMNYVPLLTDSLTGVMPGGGTALSGHGSFASEMAMRTKNKMKGLVGMDENSKHNRKLAKKEEKLAKEIIPEGLDNQKKR